MKSIRSSRKARSTKKNRVVVAIRIRTVNKNHRSLIHSDAARKGALEEHRSVKVSTHGTLFLGTPHQGGNGVQLGKLLVNVASIFVTADNHLLNHLERDSEWLQQQLGQYGPISGEFITKFAFEEYKTPTALGQSFMVCTHLFCQKRAQADNADCTSSVSRGSWCSRRRADRYPREPCRHGKVCVKCGSRI